MPRDGWVSSLTFDPANSSVAYATYATFGGGPHVWKTTDAGAMWTPLDGGGAGALPDVPRTRSPSRQRALPRHRPRHLRLDRRRPALVRRGSVPARHHRKLVLAIPAGTGAVRLHARDAALEGGAGDERGGGPSR